MKLSTWRRFSIFAVCVCGLVLASGCDLTTVDVTGLEILNTVFLGLTAAGGVAILQNV